MTPQNCLPGALEIEQSRPQRIPYPDTPEDEVGNYGLLTNGQRFARHLSPTASRAVGDLAGSLLRNGALPADLRQIAIVRVGYLTGSRYEVIQHRSLAERLGVGQGLLDQLALAEPDLAALNTSALVRFVDLLVTSNRVDDETLTSARKHFSDAQIVEIVAVTGLWWMLSRMLAVGDIPVDDVRIGDRGVQEPTVRVENEHCA